MSISIISELCYKSSRSDNSLQSLVNASLVKIVAFLGHIVFEKGIDVDPKKTDAVNSWPIPLSFSNFRSFLGLASYYKRFVEGFSSIAYPLAALTQKKVKFLWSEACERSFQELKDRLSYLRSSVDFTGRIRWVFIYCDASRIGLGSVLMQNGKVIAYV
ncbi:hypothetical protein MTR67_034380 [Solanum verrucosum]|uniref:Reverse transcriptase/retrotransposon-derived protein RNase H-like domain-containing protein n=1 Tax=Solanum verrucosum TaxID=315347 RepID=A0AAF0U839_SOLVR|nr:hypothetical protein MTR67_034380 [Solanum verrucosum]